VTIKRIAMPVLVAVTFFSIGIYSQIQPPPNPPQPPKIQPRLLVPHATYSGENLGYVITDDNVEGFFAIRVNGEWVPIPDSKEPTMKRLQTK